MYTNDEIQEFLAKFAKLLPDGHEKTKSSEQSRYRTINGKDYLIFPGTSAMSAREWGIQNHILNSVQYHYRMQGFDAYEIHGCRYSNPENPLKVGETADVEQCEYSEADFFSLYGHLPGLGLECIGDFVSREAAERILFLILNYSPC